MAEHKFHFGRKETTRKEYAIIGVILDLLHYWIVDRLKVSEKDFMQFIDELNSNFLHNQKLTDYIIRSDKWLDARINRELDSAIEDYTNSQSEVKIDSPTYTEELEGETPLGGEMRLTAPYYNNNGNENLQ